MNKKLYLRTILNIKLKIILYNSMFEEISKENVIHYFQNGKFQELLNYYIIMMIIKYIYIINKIQIYFHIIF